MKLLMMKGLPASGKSTYSKELVAKGWKRVNKDDLRSMVDCGKWSNQNEKIIKNLETILVTRLLCAGYNVVVDDTNFLYETHWKDVAIDCDSEFEIKFIDTPIEECIKRDLVRGDKSVGADVIYSMYRKYVQPNIKKTKYNIELEDAYIFDIDGTLAHMKDRSPFDYERVDEDYLDESVANILDSLSCLGKKIFIVSGRDESCSGLTSEWLETNGIKHDGLFMRPHQDKRRDTEIKKEIYENNFKDKYNILGVFDDRNSVVSMWRQLGLKCFQCEYGYF